MIESCLLLSVRTGIIQFRTEIRRGPLGYYGNIAVPSGIEPEI